MEALWPISPDSPGVFLNEPNSQRDDDILLRVRATLSAEPMGAQKCLWLDPDHPGCCNWQSIAGSKMSTSARKQRRQGQPNPTLSTDATNSNEQRGWPLPCSLGIPETPLMSNFCLSFRSQSFQTSKTVLEPPGLCTAHAEHNRPMSLPSPSECGSSWGRPIISGSLFTAFPFFL